LTNNPLLLLIVHAFSCHRPSLADYTSLLAPLLAPLWSCRCSHLYGIADFIITIRHLPSDVQVLGIMSVSAEMLRMCIPLIFEKAVAEPTFCVLYADLSAVLSRELDERATFGTDNGKTVTFRRELLNTCQDQFEAMEVQRTKLFAGGNTDEYERRQLRMRELGTIRLLAELFNKELVTQAIMKIVISGLLSRGCPGGHFDGDLIECIVQVCDATSSACQVEFIQRPTRYFFVPAPTRRSLERILVGGALNHTIGYLLLPKCVCGCVFPRLL
jgi:hypothetical protein